MTNHIDLVYHNWHVMFTICGMYANALEILAMIGIKCLKTVRKYLWASDAYRASNPQNPKDVGKSRLDPNTLKNGNFYFRFSLPLFQFWELFFNRNINQKSKTCYNFLRLLIFFLQNFLNNNVLRMPHEALHQIFLSSPISIRCPQVPNRFTLRFH